MPPEARRRIPETMVARRAPRTAARSSPTADTGRTALFALPRALRVIPGSRARGTEPPPLIAPKAPMLPRVAGRSRRASLLSGAASLLLHVALFAGMAWLAIEPPSLEEPAGIELMFDSAPSAGEEAAEAGEPAEEPTTFAEADQPDLPPLEEPAPPVTEAPPEPPPPEQPPITFAEPETPTLPPLEPPPPVQPPVTFAEPETPTLPPLEPPPPEQPPVTFTEPELAELPDMAPPEPEVAEAPPPEPELPPPPPPPPPPPQPRVERPPPRPTPPRPAQPARPATTQTATRAGTPDAAPAPQAAPRGSEEAPPVLTTASYARSPNPPRYPPLMIQRGIQGTVTIRVLVGPDGATREVKLWRTSGHELLDLSAMEAARRWAFRPAMRAGAPILHWVEIPVHFKLR